ncbi:hypothetical protein P9G84_13430 [Brevibacillus centrosporus]|uniref:hypothetical protein n=1 Tax=Brevibacillus centrosporus TaxID=54910 RepID=UPI000F3D7B51|nr:hypothetical protein [Brevibacillus centrosporus]MEC2129964.1 hypothetical protein [Brevibacillus centrosporus]RNB71891.1 hypothetical protein EDM55_07950 [Brevibacillus centrosporus]
MWLPGGEEFFHSSLQAPSRWGIHWSLRNAWRGNAKGVAASLRLQVAFLLPASRRSAGPDSTVAPPGKILLLRCFFSIAWAL